ncbi:hypothetical protein M3B43_00830 [Nesterenkonia massiliensis]|uniref:Uncharacterized protein n=1 Tax=Nesterenkonia massiliensis TaxID=1232429 RepID=A0ABT2HMH2_9MICC|nr:hypothetical protein [Nesterenkonia massiliensis]MCT1605883.1 hypothetical protein [Nesterenkonia massiliensis]
MSFKLSHQAVVGAGTLSLLLLSGCSPDDSAEFQDADPAAETAETSVEPDEPDTEADSEEEPGDAAPGEEEAEHSSASTDSTLNHEDAVDTITYPIASSSGIEGEISMGLHSLEVTDQGMLLTMSFVPDYDDSDGPARFFDGLHTAGNIDSYLLPAVNDRQNMKAYYVPNAEGEHLSGWTYFRTEPWASSMDIHVRSGETAVLWAYYPVPEDEIDTVDVAVMPGVQDFRDVQINWGDYEPGDYGNAAEVDGDE